MSHLSVLHSPFVLSLSFIDWSQTAPLQGSFHFYHKVVLVSNACPLDLCGQREYLSGFVWRLPSPVLNKAGQELFLLGNVPSTNP